MSQNRRQAHAWERAALDELRDGDPTRALDDYELNLRAVTHMHAAGFLTGPSLTVPVGPYTERTFTAGDLVIVCRNNYRQGLINGQRGTVTAVDLDHGTLTVRIAGRDLSLDALYREAGYVGLSRGRQRNDLHLVDRAVDDDPAREDCHAPQRPQPKVEDALAAVRAALARSRAQDLALTVHTR